MNSVTKDESTSKMLELPLIAKSRTVTRYRGIALVLAIVLCGAGFVAPTAGTMFSTSAGAAGLPRCVNSEVKEAYTTNRPSYGPGVKVVMRASIRNLSTVLCSVEIGPTSPSLVVANSNGAAVWNTCDVNNRPGACASYPVAHALDPGATYAKTFVWNQIAYLSSSRVPAGVYRLTGQFVGVGARHVTVFRLTSSTSTSSVTVTQADNGQILALQVGARLTVDLAGPANYTWSEPTSSAASVLERTEGMSGTTATATFVATSAGHVHVTALDNPNCYPQCLPPSRLFSLTISVVN